MTCTDIEEISGAYVLDAVTADERQAIEEHLAQCENCSRMIQDLRSVVDLLPLTVPQLVPSPDLKGRILSAIQERAVRQAQPTIVQPAIQPTVQPVQPVQPTPLPLRQPQRRSAWQRWGTPLIAAAAVLFLVLFGGMTAWNVSLQHQIAALSTNAPVTYAIQGTKTGSPITGQVIYYPAQKITVMIVHGLTQTQGTQVYQGWLLQGKQPTSIGLLHIQNDTATIEYPGDLKHFDTAAVSLEPGPNATPNAPRGQVVAAGSLAQG